MMKIDDFGVEQLHIALADLCNLIDKSNPSDGPMVKNIIGGYRVLLSNVENPLTGIAKDHFERICNVHKELCRGRYTILGKESAN